MKTFGERLKHAREKRGLSQEDLAESLGLERASASSVVRWESGTEPKAGRIEQIIRVLDIDGHWLVTGDGAMRSDPQVDATKLEVIGLIVDEEVDPLSIRQFAESVRGLTRDDARAQTEIEALARGVSQPPASPEGNGEPDEGDPPQDPPKDGTNGPPGTTRHVGP